MTANFCVVSFFHRRRWAAPQLKNSPKFSTLCWDPALNQVKLACKPAVTCTGLQAVLPDSLQPLFAAVICLLPHCLSAQKGIFSFTPYADYEQLWWDL